MVAHHTRQVLSTFSSCRAPRAWYFPLVAQGSCNHAQEQPPQHLILVCPALLLAGLAWVALPVLSASNAARFRLDDPALLGPSFPIATVPGYQESAVLVYNATEHEYLVVWQDARNGGTNYDIYGQRVSSAGSLLGENFAICAASGNQVSPAPVWNATDNEYLVVWTDSAAFDIYAQRVAASGEMLGSNFAVSTATNWQMNPTAAWNATLHEYLVAWADNRNDTSGGYTPDLYGQRVEADGSLYRKRDCHCRSAQ
jgi:hypothetical protein